MRTAVGFEVRQTHIRVSDAAADDEIIDEIAVGVAVEAIGERIDRSLELVVLPLFTVI